MVASQKRTRSERPLWSQRVPAPSGYHLNFGDVAASRRTSKRATPGPQGAKGKQGDPGPQNRADASTKSASHFSLNLFIFLMQIKMLRARFVFSTKDGGTI